MDSHGQTISTTELYDEYVLHTYARFPVRLVRGAGCRVWDEDGKAYLDFGAGIAVCSLGHSHPRMTAALAKQAATLVHTSNLYLNRPQGLLARKLVECVGTPGRIFFCNSGAEANEALYKLSRKFGNATAPVGARFEVITFEKSFHGRTLGGIAATGQDKVKKGFEPIIPGFRHVAFNDLDAVARAITPATAAILLEPIQGEGGILPATPEFLRGLRALCDRHGLLLMFDEVQCGLGHTGDWCAWKSIGAADVIPDAVSWAKGIAGGFPMGAVWIRDAEHAAISGEKKSLVALLGPGSHGTTFGGTPLACSVALEVLGVIDEEGLLANATAMGAYAREHLEALQLPSIKEIRGIGLMLGLVLDSAAFLTGSTASLAMTHLLHDAGLLAIPAGTDVIRWLPPLNVTRAEIDEAVGILRRVLEKLPVA